MFHTADGGLISLTVLLNSNTMKNDAWLLLWGFKYRKFEMIVKRVIDFVYVTSVLIIFRAIESFSSSCRFLQEFLPKNLQDKSFFAIVQVFEAISRKFLKRSPTDPPRNCSRIISESPGGSRRLFQQWLRGFLLLEFQRIFSRMSQWIRPACDYEVH